MKKLFSKKWLISISAVIAALVIVIMLDLRLAFYSLPVVIVIGSIFLVLHELGKRRPALPDYSRLHLWLGLIFWLLPAVLAVIFQVMFFRLFGYYGLAIMLAGGAAGIFVLESGHVAVPIICAAPLIYALKFAVRCGDTLVPVLFGAVAVVLFLVRNIKWKLPVAVRFALFSLICSFIFSAYWYILPGMRGYGDMASSGADTPVRHIREFEDAARKTGFPREYYSVVENCAGDTLYLTNLFNSPGIIELNPVGKHVKMHSRLHGATEKLIFDCRAGRVFTAEYTTGYFYILDAADPDKIITAKKTSIIKPSRIYMYPDSELIYLNGDQPSFPWYILNTAGEVLFEFELGRIEEIVPLSDGSFLTSFGNAIHHFRYDDKNKKLEEIKTVGFPEKGLSAFRPGPLYQHLAYDEQNETLYISDFNTGRIYSAKMPGLEIRVLAEPGRSIRHIAYSAAYHVVAAGNFVTGDIFIIDTQTGDTVFKQNVGSRLRGVTVSRDGEKVYAVSRDGVFEISLESVFKHGER